MFGNIPPGIWIRILIICYKAIRFIRIIIGILGITQKLSWSEYELSIKILCFPVSRFNPDIVVGIGIGGSILGATIAGNINKRFIAIDREVKWDNRRDVDLVDASITSERKKLFENKKVLLASAEIISGKTTIKVKKYILNFNPREIKIACIDYNPIGASEITPDYYYLTTHKVIEKPWRILKSYVCPDDIQRT